MAVLPGHVKLFPHQQKAVDELGNGKVLCGDVGVGKTFTALAYWQKHESPKDIYVLTTAKKRDDLDWQAAAAPFSVTQHDGIGVAKITVDSWNNIKKYTDVKNAFFILDEQRLVGTGAWTKAFYKIAKQNNWIMLSATPGDVWLDYAPLFIANGWYRNITDFRDQHVIYSYRQKYPKVERYIGEARLSRYRQAVLVEMPYLRHTTRHVVDICVDYDRDRFDLVVKKKWHVFENRPLRDVAELFGVMRKVVNSDPSRLEAVRILMQKHPKLIVFYNFDYELEMLRTLGTPPPRTSCLSENGLSSSSSTPMDQTSMKSTNERPASPKDCAKSIDTTSSTEAGTDQTPSPLLPATDVLVEGADAPSDFPCLGHWTEDEGDGETFLPCHVWKKHQSVLQKTNSSGSSKDSSICDLAQSSTLGSKPSMSFAIAEWNGHKHEPIPTTDSWVYLVQYTAGAEGWNCTDTDAMVFFSLNYSYKTTHQSMGRIDRLNTPFKDLYYYRLVSKSMIDKAVGAALKQKKKFNEKAFIGGWTLAA